MKFTYNGVDYKTRNVRAEMRSSVNKISDYVAWLELDYETLLSAIVAYLDGVCDRQLLEHVVNGRLNNSRVLDAEKIEENNENAD